METTEDQEVRQKPKFQRCGVIAQGLLEKYRKQADPGSIKKILYGMALLLLALAATLTAVLSKETDHRDIMFYVMPVAFIFMTGMTVWEFKDHYLWHKNQNAFLLKWLQEHADEKPEIRYVLGYVYQEGVLCSQDSKEAARWYEKADGYPFADNDLGVSYAEGDGVPQDVHRAKWLFKNAAKSGALYANENIEALKKL